MSQPNERGIALVITLLLTATMSVMAASLMFLSQTETYATMNYRMMSQSRYAAEAAIQRAGHFLMDPSLYDPSAEPLSNYDYDQSPVTVVATGDPVILSTVPADSTYPVAAVQTAFEAFVAGEFTAERNTLTYGASAQLIAMQSFMAYGGNQTVIQTWRITGVGGVQGPREATVEVTATIETPKVPSNAYAAFATGTGCGAMLFHGNTTINSYDSEDPGAGATPTTTNEGGNVGTNGNLSIEGSVDVMGNLYSPRTGVGSCEEGAVTALTESGNADVEGTIVQLPAEVSYPLPIVPAVPTNTVTINNGSLGNICDTLGLDEGTNCEVNGATNTVTIGGGGGEISLPGIEVANGITLVFEANPGSAQVINLNSLGGNGSIEVAANMSGASNESVVLKVAGKNADGTDMAEPFDLATMSWKQNTTVDLDRYNAAALQIVYPGTGTITINGNNQSAASIYAPNAEFVLLGTADLYGSVLAKTIEVGGTGSIHYDRRLSRESFVAGHPLASTFSWKRVN
jgi:Tfp pilus assembly protein PilX